jgi:GTP-binding protein HflX
LPSEPRERAVLVGLDLKGRVSRVSPTEIVTSVEDSIEELRVLAESAGAEVVDKVVQGRETGHAATLIGSGKVEELAAQVTAQSIERN